MAIEQISDHKAQALDRLMEEYERKPKMEGFLNALNGQIQSIEDMFFAMLDARSVYAAAGKNLDRIGTTVGIKRPFGFDDTAYRILVLAKIGLNVSQGETEQVIAVFKLITQATEVHLQEYFPAGVGLFSNAKVDDALVDLVYSFVQDAVGGGVRVDHFGYYDDDNAFAFAGGAGHGGFGDATDPLAGGELGSLYEPSVPVFAFDGDESDESVEGFGSVFDPVLGGKFTA